jgi:hypothetical protein
VWTPPGVSGMLLNFSGFVSATNRTWLRDAFLYEDPGSNFNKHLISLTVRGSAVGWGTMLQAGKSRVLFPIRQLGFSIDLILTAALWPWGLVSL